MMNAWNSKNVFILAALGTLCSSGKAYSILSVGAAGQDRYLRALAKTERGGPEALKITIHSKDY